MTADASAGSASTGVDDEAPLTANASRARDPQFDSAIIGNSTGQLLNPAELSQATGMRFVQLVGAGRRPARASRDAGFLPAASSARRRAGVRDRSIPGAATILPTAAGQLVPVSGSMAKARSTMPGSCSPGARSTARSSGSRSASACASATNPGRLLELRGDLAAGHEINRPWIRSHGSRPFAGTVSDVFPASALLERADQEACRPMCRSCCSCLRLFHTILPQPGTDAAAEREACNAALQIASSPAGRTAISSTTASTMR